MPCATRGPAHKLCRSLPTARARKGIHSHAPPPPFPIPQHSHTAPDLEDQEVVCIWPYHSTILTWPGRQQGMVLWRFHEFVPATQCHPSRRKRQG